MSDTASDRRGLPESVKMRHSAHFVDDLSARNEAPVGRLISIEDIEPDPAQPRAVLGDLTELTRSIDQKGVLEPILVRANPDPDETSKAFRIISGERRFQAAVAAGLIEIPAIEMEVDEDEALEIALIENLQRRDLSPFEEADGYARLAELHGYTHEQIATAVGKSRTVVTESLGLLEFPAAARQAALTLGVTTKSTLVQILKLTGDPKKMIALLEKIATQGLSRDDLRETARAARKTAAQGGASATRPRPYTFKFKSPDRSFSLALSFRRSTVDKGDLISALEDILTDLKSREEPLV